MDKPAIPLRAAVASALCCRSLAPRRPRTIFMLSSTSVNRAPLLAALVLGLLCPSCVFDDGEDGRAAWAEVQKLKIAYLAAAPENRIEAKQQWADGVREYLRRWPDHHGAVNTWNHLQLDYAEQLEANGHFRQAEMHYESLLNRAPENAIARNGFDRVRRRQSLSREDFSNLSIGMTSREVVDRLGLPRPGWERHDTRHGVPVESWYYRDTAGTIRGIHFRNGVVFEIDLD